MFHPCVLRAPSALKRRPSFPVRFVRIGSRLEQLLHHVVMTEEHRVVERRVRISFLSIDVRSVSDQELDHVLATVVGGIVNASLLLLFRPLGGQLVHVRARRQGLSHRLQVVGFDAGHETFHVLGVRIRSTSPVDAFDASCACSEPNRRTTPRPTSPIPRKKRGSFSPERWTSRFHRPDRSRGGACGCEWEAVCPPFVPSVRSYPFSLIGDIHSQDPEGSRSVPGSNPNRDRFDPGSNPMGNPMGSESVLCGRHVRALGTSPHERAMQARTCVARTGKASIGCGKVEKPWRRKRTRCHSAKTSDPSPALEKLGKLVNVSGFLQNETEETKAEVVESEVVEEDPPLEELVEEAVSGGKFDGFLYKLRRLYGVGIMTMVYVHHSVVGFCVPAILPQIVPDMGLSDTESASLTFGFTLFYALSLIPAGIVADRVRRIDLLSASLVVWSASILVASNSKTFSTLLLARLLCAVSQSTMNPVAFSLIPELFPQQRTTAMSFYNIAIYAGRSLSFTAALASFKAETLRRIPLDKFDPMSMSMLYIQGDMVVASPIWNYDFIPTAAFEQSWRAIFTSIGQAGLVLAIVLFFTAFDPRESPEVRKLSHERSLAESRKVHSGSDEAEKDQGFLSSLTEIVSDKGFQCVTAAGAFNDLGGWALISWQALFYERTYGLDAEQYAPLLALVLPIGGIIGGVGGGLLGDYLSRNFPAGRALLTAGATAFSAPVLAASILAPDYRTSTSMLLLAFGLSEAWRAPSAIILREISPPGKASTATAIHLCLRNLIGATGPLLVNWLAYAKGLGLQQSLLLVPLMYIFSALTFWKTELLVAARQKEA